MAIDIPMDTNCAPLVDLIVYSYKTYNLENVYGHQTILTGPFSICYCCLVSKQP